MGAGRGATLVPLSNGVDPSGQVLGVDLSVGMVVLLRRDVEQLGVAKATMRRKNAEALDVAAGP